MVILNLRFLQLIAQEQYASNPILFISGKIHSSHKRARLLQNQALTCFTVLNGIMTLCKFVFAKRCWQQDLLGNGKARTPVPEGIKGVLLMERTGRGYAEQELTGIILTSVKGLD